VDLKKITDANREAWNEVTPIHQNARKINLKSEFKNAGFSTLDPKITAKLREIGVEGRRVAQVCCNNGRELLSLINIGAKSGAGFDISDAAIEEAIELKNISKLPAEFIRTDAYDISIEFYNEFDLVYISIGALAWLPELDEFFKIVSRLLKNTGHLVIYEQHPFVYMLAQPGDELYVESDPIKIVHSYFREEPWIDTDGIDYVGKSRYNAKVCYNFTQALSKIINAIIKNDIKLQELNEYPHDISDEFEHLAGQDKLALSYILIGQKEGR